MWKNIENGFEFFPVLTIVSWAPLQSHQVFPSAPFLVLCCSDCVPGPPRGFGEQGIYFRGTGEQRPNFEGNRGTKTILGNREHKKTNFRFLGNKPIYFRGTREQEPPPPPWEGLMFGNTVLSVHSILTDFNYATLTSPDIFQKTVYCRLPLLR